MIAAMAPTTPANPKIHQKIFLAGPSEGDGLFELNWSTVVFTFCAVTPPDWFSDLIRTSAMSKAQRSSVVPDVQYMH
jgi:hypothetical protein